MMLYISQQRAIDICIYTLYCGNVRMEDSIPESFSTPACNVEGFDRIGGPNNEASTHIFGVAAASACGPD